MTKQQRYLEMVAARKACRACEGLTNQSAVDGDRFDSDEVGSWSLWQGNLDVELSFGDGDYHREKVAQYVMGDAS